MKEAHGVFAKRFVTLILCGITVLLCIVSSGCAPSSEHTDTDILSDVTNGFETLHPSEDTEADDSGVFEETENDQTLPQDQQSSNDTLYEDTEDTYTDGITTDGYITDSTIDQTEGTIEETDPPLTQAPETDPPATDAPKPTVKTSTPEILGTYRQASDRIIIYGKTEPDALITYSWGSDSSFTDSARGEYFYVEVNGSGTQNVTLYATADGKKASDKVSFDVSFKSVELTDVFGGRNSRLYLRSTVDTLFGSSSTTEKTLQNTKTLITSKLKKIQSLTGKDTKLIYILAPNPVNVYYDQMYPYLVTNSRSSTAAMQFVSYMNGAGKHEDIIVPDLMKTFDLHKDEPIYFRTDTHWSELGAYYAYVEMMNSIKKDFPSASAHPLSDFTIVDTDCSAGDLANLLKAKDMRECTPFFHANFEQTGQFYTAKRDAGNIVCNIPVGTYPTVSTVNNSSLPTGYLIGDSYGAFFLPFAGMGFKKLVVNQGILWDYPINEEILKTEKPDYIVFVYTDRNIGGNLAQLLI